MELGKVIEPFWKGVTILDAINRDSWEEVKYQH